jgi:C-terminal processing protease CtpA/Prc
VNNYEELEASFEGITKSTGVVFGRSLLRNGNFAAVVLYTVKGAPADRAGIKRGDIFDKVNNEVFTIDNYANLYNTENYTLSYATVSDSVAIPTGKTVQLMAEEVHENPIYLDTVYTIENKKIGYLVYNGFMSDYDIQLNTVFAKFKAQQIDKLILDLRYNLGGSGQSATYLASMIYNTDTTKIFYKTQCNKRFGKDVLDEDPDALNSYFEKYITIRDPYSSTSINTLNLTDIHIIATGSSASASELVINALKPYITVTTVGSTTIGKNVGSFTIKDINKNGIINPRHKWAMQPIVFKVANKNGESDYSNGIVPDIYARETRDNIKQLGDTSEILLKTALNSIFGITQSQSTRISTHTDRGMVLSKEYAPFATTLNMDSERFRTSGLKNFRK